MTRKKAFGRKAKDLQHCSILSILFIIIESFSLTNSYKVLIWEWSLVATDVFWADISPTNDSLGLAKIIIMIMMMMKNDDPGIMF